MHEPQSEVVGENDNGSAGRRLAFRWSTGLKLVFSLGLLAVVVYFVDFSEFLDAVVDVSVTYLVIFALFVYLDRALVVYKWNLLLVARSVHVPFLHLFWLYSTALLSGVVLPTTVGADAFRVYDLKKRGISAKFTIASIVVERALGFISMLGIASLGLGVSIYLIEDNLLPFIGIAWGIAAGVLICAVFFLVVRSGKFNAGLDRLAAKYAHQRTISRIHEIYRNLREYRNDTGVLMQVTALTLVRQCVPIFMNILLVYAYGVQATFLELVAIIPLIVLGTRLPISMDGIGVQEGLYVVLFGLVGVSAAQALLMSVTFRAMSMLCTLPFGIIYIFHNRSLAESA